MKQRIAIISPGGTIEKTYDELSGVLANQVSVLDIMLASLELRGIDVRRIQLMNKDSLDMTAEDHDLIAETADDMARATDGVVIVHGTDRLQYSGERVVDRFRVIGPAPGIGHGRGVLFGHWYLSRAQGAVGA